MANIDLATITGGDGSRGFKLEGPAQRGGHWLEHLGLAVSTAGDVNGDGFADVLLGVPWADGRADGRVEAGDNYVIFGRAGGFAPVITLDSIAAGNGSRGFMLRGAQTGDYAGYSVSTAGDVNGDGLDDVVIGAPWADGPGDARSAAGDNYVVFGRLGGFPAVVDLAAIAAGDGSQGFVLQGERAGDLAGYAVSSAGDLNNDGFDDVVIGAPLADGPADARRDAGDSYVVWGKAGGFPATIDLADITKGDGSLGFVVQGETEPDWLGWSVFSLGADVNGDGYDDLILGASWASGPGETRHYAGDTYIVFGRSGHFPATLDSAAITHGDGSLGFVLQGETVEDYAGWGVSTAGDINGDGFDDVVVGAFLGDGPADGRTTAGDSWVIFGRGNGFAPAIDLADITAGDGSQGFVLHGEEEGDQAGRAVSSAGDVNGDGYDDLLIGAPYADGPGNSRSLAGDAYVVFGRASGFPAVFDLGAITAGDGSQGFAIQGEIKRDFTGFFVAAAGDVNGDGFDDMVLGARQSDGAIDGSESSGDAYVIFGSATIGGAPNEVTHQGNASSQMLAGSPGADVMIGGLGNDALVGRGGYDVLRGAAGDDSLAISDRWFGRIDGGSGQDRLLIDGALTLSDADFRRISEIEAVQVINHDVDITLGAIASRAIEGRASDGFRLLVDGSLVRNASVTIAGSALMRPLTADFGNNAGSSVLTGGASADRLFGGSGADSLAGGGGADTLSSGSGRDTVAGGAGDDSYMVDGPVRIVEAAGDGDDRVFASRSYALTAGAAVEILSTANHAGTTALDLVGNEFAQALYGNAGANRLDGGAGADTLVGVGGNDWYFVDNAGDTIVERTGEGYADRVFASATFALNARAEVEIISTADQSATRALDLTGNEFAQTLVGNAGNNILNGGGGADAMQGLAGNDWYFVDNPGDRVIEAAGQGTADRVFAGVSYTLGAASDVEILSTTSANGTAAINLRGNHVANLIYGNAGDNILSGLGGSDTLFGFGGNDVFLFERAPGGATDVAQIRDFDPVTDSFWLSRHAFVGPAPGALAATAFTVGGGASTANQHVIYENLTGRLFFDPDGSGADPQILFATLTTMPTLTAADFLIV